MKYNKRDKPFPSKINNKINLEKPIYFQHLKIINGVKFTQREIDIIACILSGRTAKTIASILSIAPRTVEKHTHNIMQKLERNSRENIRDFIEKSPQFSLIKNHYLNLFVEATFKQQLQKILAVVDKKRPSFLIVYEPGQENKIVPIYRLEKHLKLAGIKVAFAARKQHKPVAHLIRKIESQGIDHILYGVSEALIAQLQRCDSGAKLEISLLAQRAARNPGSVICLLAERETIKDIPQPIQDIGYLDFGGQENYYLSVFEVLKKVLPDINLDKIISEFKNQYEITYGSSNKLSSHIGSDERGLPQSEASNIISPNTLIKEKSRLLIGCTLCFSAFGILFLAFNGNKSGKIIEENKFQELQFIRADMPVPASKLLLERPYLIAKIEEKLKEQKGIKTIALVGFGGAGKTTIARQYAGFQKLPVVWEINAETKESLINSFENLATILSKTEEDKKILRGLQDIKDPKEREGKLLLFVKEKLKYCSNWLLIYDNVEKFSEIQKYFPSDLNTWGKGKVILSTRDGHVQNNNLIDLTIQVGELNHEEKLRLFYQIMYNGSVSSLLGSIRSKQNEKTIEFLNNIPSFPLDVSTAAYYLKAINISYKEYLNRLTQNDSKFVEIQETVLKASTEYSKTRYKIISLSLKDLINKQKDFIDLLLLLSLLDSRNIPRDLLERFKGPLTVDNFIYYLKKYSLIANPSLKSTAAPQAHIFIHHSIQGISYSYLNGLLKLQKDSILLRKIIFVLDDYLDQILEQEDIGKMQIMVGHLDRLLSKRGILTNFSQGLLANKLGCIYFFLNKDKSSQTINDSLKNFLRENLKRLSSEDNFRIARSYLHIGVVYTELRIYKEAIVSLESAAQIYRKSGLKGVRELSWTLSHLGNVYRRLGNYEKARDYLDESVRLNKQYGADHKRIIRTLSCLGSVFRGLGFYQKSIETLEESLNLCKRYYPEDHFRAGRILRSLGNVYRRLGDYQQAKKYLENSLLIFNKNFPENHINIGLGLAYLGNCLRQKGEYEKSRDCLEQSLKIHQIHFEENHHRMGWILFQLASTYIAMGKRQETYKLFNKILKIYDKDFGEENIETASLLRNIAEIYIEMNHITEAENFIKNSLNILKSRKHIDVYRSLEVLGDIYLRKSALLFSDKNTQERQNLQRQAIEQFNQALQIAKQNFPTDSAHIQRISSKIKNIQVKRL